MEESTLRWPTDKEREEMEEVCEVPHTEKSKSVHVQNPTVLPVLKIIFIHQHER